MSDTAGCTCAQSPPFANMASFARTGGVVTEEMIARASQALAAYTSDKIENPPATSVRTVWDDDDDEDFPEGITYHGFA